VAGYTVIGGGAIGTTLAVALQRRGRDVLVVEVDPERVAALRDGVVLRDGARGWAARLSAYQPGAVPVGPLRRVLLATKTQHNPAALAWLGPRLATDGYVVSCQNGDNSAEVAGAVGRSRTLLAMVDIAADVMTPGEIRLGGSMDVAVGELEGPVTARVRDLTADLRPFVKAAATDNVSGHIWAKRGLGAVLAASALQDEHVAVVVDHHRDLMARILATVYDVARSAGIRLVPVHDCDPSRFGSGQDLRAMRSALEPLVRRFAGMSKDRSGVFRDIAVHHRRTEAHGELTELSARARRAGVDAELLLRLDAMLTELEDGRRPFAAANLDELAALSGPRRSAAR
jgi:ketopantoate reductase